MKTFDVPDWVIAPFCKLGVFEDDYHLYGACRALGFVRMAAAALEKMGNSEEETDPQKVAEYHAYAGISAARTAIDAAASWLNMVLKLNFPSGNQVDLSKKRVPKRGRESPSRNRGIPSSFGLPRKGD